MWINCRVTKHEFIAATIECHSMEKEKKNWVVFTTILTSVVMVTSFTLIWYVKWIKEGKWHS